MHEWMSDYRLQLYRQGLWTQLRPTSNSPPPPLSLQTDWAWFFNYIHLPVNYLHMYLLFPGNSSFHFWIHILGCRHKRSFQDCCGKSNALGSFWDWHIHPHLVSRNKSPGQGQRSSENRTLQTRDLPPPFSTRCPPNIQTVSFFLSSLAIRRDKRMNSGWLYASKMLTFVSNCNEYRLQKWLSSFTPPCVRTLGWGLCYTRRPTTPLLRMWTLGQQPLTLAGSMTCTVQLKWQRQCHAPAKLRPQETA